MIKIFIKVKPGSFKDEIIMDKENNITIKIKAKPIDGEANKYLVLFLSKKLNIKKNEIVIEHGEHSQFKRLVLNMNENDFKKAFDKYRAK